MRKRSGRGETIGRYAFAWRNDLSGAVIPEGVRRIGEYAFIGCDRLVGVSTGNGAEEIGMGAFSCCGELTEITIGEKMKKICGGAFFNSGVKDIYYKGTKKQWNEIEKCEDWDNGTGAYVVHCTDGDI